MREQVRVGMREIRNLAGNILWQGNVSTMRQAVEQAVTEGVNLQSAYLQGAYLRGANLEGANLEGAYLAGANLRLVNLQSANLRLANLEGANLRLANLQSANLEGAYLAGVNLRLANLRGANLIKADLSGAKCSYITTEGAKADFPLFRIGNLVLCDKSMWFEDSLVEPDKLVSFLLKEPSLNRYLKTVNLLTNLRKEGLHEISQKQLPELGELEQGVSLDDYE